MRVLVTGSRTWTKRTVIWWKLHELAIRAYGEYDTGHVLTVVHGDCPKGADRSVKQWLQFQAAELWTPVTIIEEAHPADWKLGRGAGPIRNQHMVNLGADLCLAFMMPGSRGTADCVARAREAGIETRVFTGEETDA